MTEAKPDALLNCIKIHPWRNKECCLPAGTTTVDLVGDLKGLLKSGDFLLLEEVKGPRTGLRADADRNHRQVVRLTKVEAVQDPLVMPPLKLTRVTWDRADQLGYPLYLSVKLSDGTLVEEMSVARGNLVLADHGRTLREWHPGDPANPEARGIETGIRPYRFHLKKGPLSFRVPMPKANEGAAAASKLFVTDPRQAEAQVSLVIKTATGSSMAAAPVSDLLDSGSFDLDFVVETDNDGQAGVRFGDGTFGQMPPDDGFIEATYRVGVGSGGNVGAESLIHIIRPEPLPAGWPDIADPAPDEPNPIRNPLAAWGGTNAEPLAQVKRLAPPAFHSEQFRAVTEDDYARAAEKLPEVSKAVATFRWTGSWHTVFLTIDPAGQTELSPALESRVTSWVTRYTQAGYDLEIDGPVYAPLDIEIEVCTEPDHFRADVEEALLDALSSRILPDGRRGFFYPDNFTFGQSLYLSQLYAAVEEVEGVVGSGDEISTLRQGDKQ